MMNEQVPTSFAAPTTWFACRKKWGVSLRTLNGEQCISIEVSEPEDDFFVWRLAEREDLALMSPDEAFDLASLLKEVAEVSCSKFVEE